jgi:hypothetical protein
MTYHITYNRPTVRTDATANVSQQIGFYLNRVYPLADLRPKSQGFLWSK